MRERFKGFQFRPWAWLLAVKYLVKRPFIKPIRWARVALSWLWRPFARPLRGGWRLLGRMGLAWRNLLTWFVWEPLVLITFPIWLPVSWLWAYIKVALPYLERFSGRLGLAIRNILVLFVWETVYMLFIRPLLWLWRRLLWPILARLGRIGHLIGRFLRARWQATAPRRALWQRRWRSRWLLKRARLHLFLYNPQPPVVAVTAPRRPRSQPMLPAPSRRRRLLTAVMSLGIISVVSLIAYQQRPVQTAVANIDLNMSPQIIVATPSPAPPTLTPKPTSPVKLTPWATPDPLSEGGSIAFTIHREGNSDIYVLPIGQPEPLRLTSHPAADRNPVWSPDGQKIAFASRRSGNWDVYIYDFTVGSLAQVTTHPGFDGGPTWSPDGQWLAFESYRNDNLDVYLMPADGTSDPWRITEDAAPDFAPVWAPTMGRHIAFTSWRSGNQDIFLRSLDEIDDATAVNVTASPALHEDHAAFTPDGRFLSYVEENDGLNLIVTVPLTAQYELAGPPTSLNQQGVHPAWAVDSQSLVYVLNQNERSYLVGGTRQAWGVTPQIFASDGRISEPSWSAVTLTPDLVATIKDIDAAKANSPLFLEAVSDPILLFQLPVNAPSPYLSDRVDQSFLALRERVETEAGWDLLGRLDDMFQALDQRPLPGESAQTWNKAGRAFDLFAREVLADEPQIEVVREDRGVATYWRVYIRAAVQDGSLGEPLRVQPWDFTARSGDDPRYYDQGGKLKDEIPAGYYIDFTTMAADYGWTRVPADSSWRTYFPAIRFWHYENRDNLTWEEAMLELYSAEAITAVFGESTP